MTPDEGHIQTGPQATHVTAPDAEKSPSREMLDTMMAALQTIRTLCSYPLKPFINPAGQDPLVQCHSGVRGCLEDLRGDPQVRAVLGQSTQPADGALNYLLRQLLRQMRHWCVDVVAQAGVFAQDQELAMILQQFREDNDVRWVLGGPERVAVLVPNPLPPAARAKAVQYTRQHFGFDVKSVLGITFSPGQVGLDLVDNHNRRHAMYFEHLARAYLLLEAADNIPAHINLLPSGDPACPEPANKD
jgi:hypothetical protein